MGNGFAVQPVKVNNDSTTIEIWNLLSTFIGVTLEFYCVSNVFASVGVNSHNKMIQFCG
jgi:hypothetical protein